MATTFRRYSPNDEKDMWIQMNGAPAYFGNAARNYLKNTYPQWIGQEGPVEWPPRSPDHNPLNLYFWKYMKNVIFAQVLITREELLERIQQALQKRELSTLISSIGIQACTFREILKISLINRYF